MSDSEMYWAHCGPTLNPEMVANTPDMLVVFHCWRCNESVLIGRIHGFVYAKRAEWHDMGLCLVAYVERKHGEQFTV